MQLIPNNASIWLYVEMHAAMLCILAHSPNGLRLSIWLDTTRVSNIRIFGTLRQQSYAQGVPLVEIR